MDSESQTHQFHHPLQPQLNNNSSQFEANQISGFSFNSSVDSGFQLGVGNLNSGFHLNSSAANSTTDVSGFQLNSSVAAPAQDSNQSSNLAGFHLNSCAAQNLNSTANVSGFQLNSCVAASAPQNLNSATNAAGFQLNSSSAAAQNLNPGSNLAGFQLNSCAGENSALQNSNVSGFQMDSSAVGNAASGGAQNQNSSSNLSGFGLNSSVVGNVASPGAQNPNASSNLAAFGLNSSAVGNVASPGAQNPNSSSNVSGAAGGEVSNGAGTTGKAGVEQARKKRGRPRKVVPEGGNVTANGGDLSGGDPSVKRSRGRPAGSGKKSSDASGANGGNFTAETIFVGAGEDISYKIMSFVQQGPQTVCIISASGSISNVTLRQSATSGHNVTYEGRYEIVSLSGSFHPLKNGSRSGTLCVSLLGKDGYLVGGSVAGMLVAATPIQVIVGSFVADTKKQKAKLPPASNIFNFSAPASGVATSPSQGASSESTEENHDSPLNHGQGPHLNAGQPMQQNMSMYSPMTWTTPTPIKMPPN